MPDDATGRSFFERVVAGTPGGDALVTCLQCGTCGGSCPSAADMDATPRKLFAMISAGMEDEVLDSNTFWYCVSCYYCTVRCPQDIPITDIMYTLKRMAVAKGRYSKESHVDFSNSFIGFVEQNGRSFEFGLMTRYHLLHAPIDSMRKSGLGLEMLSKGRFSMRPEKIKNMPQLTAILTEAKRIAALQEV
jgi:heterodisulfide reductase subunit C